MFGLASEMRPGAAAQPLNLFAVGSGGSLQNFKFVEFLGGERQDMPSQGAFSFESDREQIQRLEDGMIAAFGHAVIENYAQSGERTIEYRRRGLHALSSREPPLTACPSRVLLRRQPGRQDAARRAFANARR